MKKKDIFINHGMESHSYEEHMDCLECLQIHIEYLQAVKEAGGITKFKKALSPKKEEGK